MGLECISVVMQRGRLRWFGHVEWMGDGGWVNRIRSMNVEGVSARGKPKKTWNEIIQKDLTDMQTCKEPSKNMMMIFYFFFFFISKDAAQGQKQKVVKKSPLITAP